MTQGNLVGGNVAISDGLVTITTGGNTISVIAPGIENLGINLNGTGYHIYSDQHVVGPVGYFNGPNGLWNNLLEEPAPTLGFTSSNTPVAQGQYGYAPGLGVVQHFFNPSGMTVINVTASGHMLYPGIVTRTLEVVNGNYVVTTYGVGNGILPHPNDWLSNWVWGANVGRLARETIYEEANDIAFPPPECFPAQTPIAISLTETRPISDIRVGDTVLAFDPAADLGRGALVPRKVVRLYRNTTEEWVKLTWAEGGEAKELIATPSPHFLDRFGNFPTIEEMLENGRATVILASGELTEVTAERITYSAQTAHLFEQAEAVGMVAGNAALKPAVTGAWQTYNFEVEDLHTYVAGGVRVHNRSGFLGRVGNTIDTALDNLLGGNDGDGSVGWPNLRYFSIALPLDEEILAIEACWRRVTRSAEDLLQKGN